MFTGIIECLGKVVFLEKEKTNIHVTVESPISKELKIDQSIAHNGVCLTVVSKNEDQHTVTVIDETILKTNFSRLKVGRSLNLERCLKVGSRLDGHMVQGHVDEVATCIEVIEEMGSWRYIFKGTQQVKNLIVNKGSICIKDNEIIETGIKKGLNIVDLTGAGDLFAAGFLHGYSNKMNLKESLEKGTEMSSKVIQQIGARL